MGPEDRSNGRVGSGVQEATTPASPTHHSRWTLSLRDRLAEGRPGWGWGRAGDNSRLGTGVWGHPSEPPGGAVPGRTRVWGGEQEEGCSRRPGWAGPPPNQGALTAPRLGQARRAEERARCRWARGKRHSGHVQSPRSGRAGLSRGEKWGGCSQASAEGASGRGPSRRLSGFGS